MFSSIAPKNSVTFVSSCSQSSPGDARSVFEQEATEKTEEITAGVDGWNRF